MARTSGLELPLCFTVNQPSNARLDGINIKYMFYMLYLQSINKCFSALRYEWLDPSIKKVNNKLCKPPYGAKPPLDDRDFLCCRLNGAEKRMKNFSILPSSCQHNGELLLL